jgi:hypothetical protein
MDANKISKTYKSKLINALNTDEYISKFRVANLYKRLPLYLTRSDLTLFNDEKTLFDLVISNIIHDLHMDFNKNLIWHINVMRKFTIFS